MQIAILEKVGSYGQNLDSIKKEMSMMQDSFTKMVSPQQSQIRKQIPQQEYQQPQQQEKEFSPDDFQTSQKKPQQKRV